MVTDVLGKRERCDLALAREHQFELWSRGGDDFLGKQTPRPFKESTKNIAAIVNSQAIALILQALNLSQIIKRRKKMIHAT